MDHAVQSIRPFIGAKDFEQSRNFYRELSFKEHVIAPNFSLFTTGEVGFYLQDYYVQDWIDNTMVFLEVDNVERYYNELLQLDLSARYENVRLVPIKNESWGRECFLHDPSGVLWHFGQFYK